MTFLKTIYKMLASMKFAIILLIFIAMYSIALVAFSEFYPSSDQNMFSKVVNSKDVNSKFSKYITIHNPEGKRDTQIVQGEFIREYFYTEIAGWSNFQYRVINDYLGIFDQFSSFLYRFLLGVLTLSLMICILVNTKVMFREAFHLKYQSKAYIKNHRKRIENNFSLPDDNESTIKNLVSKIFPKFNLVINKKATSIENNEYVFAAGKGSYSKLGAWFMHLGMVLLILGGLVTSVFGLRFFSYAWKGDSELIKNKQRIDKELDKGFNVLVNDYYVTYVDSSFLFTKEDYNFNGYGRKMIADYKSDLTAIDETGKEVFRKTIEVNDPLGFKGLTFYQSNSIEFAQKDYNLYGEYFFQNVKIIIEVVNHNGSGNEVTSYPVITGYREKTKIPNTDMTIIVELFSCSYDQIFGPVERAYMRNQQIVSNIFDKDDNLIARFGSYLNPMQASENITPGELDNTEWNSKIHIKNVSLEEVQPYFFTGIEISSNPGASIIWLGFILSTFGMMLSFFLSHKQIWILISKENSEYKISVVNKSSTGSYSFNEEIKKAVNSISS